MANNDIAKKYILWDKSASSVFHLESQVYLPMVGTMNISAAFKTVDPLPTIL